MNNQKEEEWTPQGTAIALGIACAALIACIVLNLGRTLGTLAFLAVIVCFFVFIYVGARWMMRATKRRVSAELTLRRFRGPSLPEVPGRISDAYQSLPSVDISDPIREPPEISRNPLKAMFQKGINEYVKYLENEYNSINRKIRKITEHYGITSSIVAKQQKYLGEICYAAQHLIQQIETTHPIVVTSPPAAFLPLLKPVAPVLLTSADLAAKDKFHGRLGGAIGRTIGTQGAQHPAAAAIAIAGSIAYAVVDSQRTVRQMNESAHEVESYRRQTLHQIDEWALVHDELVQISLAVGQYSVELTNLLFEIVPAARDGRLGVDKPIDSSMMTKMIRLKQYALLANLHVVRTT